jgi:hypothetical protein
VIKNAGQQPCLGNNQQTTDAMVQRGDNKGDLSPPLFTFVTDL